MIFYYSLSRTEWQDLLASTRISSVICKNSVLVNLFLKQEYTTLASISAVFYLKSNSTQLMITASLLCDTKPLLNIAEYSVLLTDVMTVGIVCKLVWAFFCFASLWLQKCFLFLLSAAAFCLHVVQVWLPVVFKVVSGTAFSEHGIPMSLNFLRAVLKGPLFVMRHFWTVMLVIFLNKTECIWNIARWTNKLLGEMCTLWNVSYKSVCLFVFFPQNYLYKCDFFLSTNISGSGRDYYQQDWSHWVLVGVRYKGNKGIKLVFLLSKVKVKFLKIFEGRLKS